MTHWLPAGFVAPAEVAVPFGHRLRQVRPTDRRLLLVADPTLVDTVARRDLARWADEMRRGSAYTYMLLDADETAILGGVRIAPTGVDRWLVVECRGTHLAAAFDELVPQWVAAHWPSIRT